MDERLAIRELAEVHIPAAQAVMSRSVLEHADDIDDPVDLHEPIILADVNDLHGSYIQPDGAFMLVVEDTQTGEIVATGGLRNGAFDPDHVPPQLALLERRYRDGATGRLIRLHVLQEHRRRGIGRALVQAIIDRARTKPQYKRLAVHTHPYSPGVLPFVLAMGFEEVLDDMEASRQIFFELPLA
jgi:GNAT superfamily N-acetyltransferase